MAGATCMSRLRCVRHANPLRTCPGWMPEQAPAVYDSRVMSCVFCRATAVCTACHVRQLALEHGHTRSVVRHFQNTSHTAPPSDSLSPAQAMLHSAVAAARRRATAAAKTARRLPRRSSILARTSPLACRSISSSWTAPVRFFHCPPSAMSSAGEAAGPKALVRDAHAEVG